MVWEARRPSACPRLGSVRFIAVRPRRFGQDRVLPSGGYQAGWQDPSEDKNFSDRKFFRFIQISTSSPSAWWFRTDLDVATRFRDASLSEDETLRDF